MVRRRPLVVLGNHLETMCGKLVGHVKSGPMYTKVDQSAESGKIICAVWQIWGFNMTAPYKWAKVQKVGQSTSGAKSLETDLPGTGRSQ